MADVDRLADPLSAAHPWMVRGDFAVVNAAATDEATRSGGGTVPLWGGTVDGQQVAVLLHGTGPGTPVPTVSTVLGGATQPGPDTDPGHRSLLTTRPLTGALDVLAVFLPQAGATGTPMLLLLGPPGGRVAADVPGASQALAQGDDGVSVYALSPGATSYAGRVTVTTGGLTRELHVDSAAG